MQRLLFFDIWPGQPYVATTRLAARANIIRWEVKAYDVEEYAVKDLSEDSAQFGAVALALTADTLPAAEDPKPSSFKGQMLIEKTKELALPTALICPRPAAGHTLSPLGDRDVVINAINQRKVRKQFSGWLTMLTTG
jgi:hypothetical protein